jgi:hypothetical protein
LSCHRFRANAFRLLLHSFAYNLVNLFRLQLPLSMRSAQIETLRIQLFKIGARIRETARCIRIHLASGWPFQNLFQTVCNSSWNVPPCSKTHSRKGQAELSRKTLRNVKTTATQTHRTVDYRARSFPLSASVLPALRFSPLMN